MIFHILRVQVSNVELFHVPNHLRTREVPEGVARQAQANRGTGIIRAGDLGANAETAQKLPAQPLTSSASANEITTRACLPPLHMRRPAFFVFALPHLHRFRIILNLSVLRIEMQFAFRLPRDV